MWCLASCLGFVEWATRANWLGIHNYPIHTTKYSCGWRGDQLKWNSDMASESLLTCCTIIRLVKLSKWTINIILIAFFFFFLFGFSSFYHSNFLYIYLSSMSVYNMSKGCLSLHCLKIILLWIFFFLSSSFCLSFANKKFVFGWYLTLP